MTNNCVCVCTLISDFIVIMSLAEQWTKILGGDEKVEKAQVEAQVEAQAEAHEGAHEGAHKGAQDRVTDKGFDLPKFVLGDAPYLDPEIYKFSVEGLKGLVEGVNPKTKEHYLPDNEFEELFKMKRESFDKLRQWKQGELKKKVGLF